MLKVLIYGYCIGARPSRKLAQACVEDVAFRFLAANQLPDQGILAIVQNLKAT